MGGLSVITPPKRRGIADLSGVILRLADVQLPLHKGSLKSSKTFMPS